MDAATPAGLASLGILRAAVLPGTLAQATTYDVPLLTIGRGVAASFDAFLNRKLARQEAATYIVAGDKTSLGLDRFPVEKVSKVELQLWGDAGGAWTDYTASALETLDLDAGLVSFGYALGTEKDRVRVTFAGGFWIDLSPDLSGQPPEGATAIPADLVNAWTLQVAAEAVARNIADTGIIRPETEKASTSMSKFDFVPEVLSILENGYRRFSF